MASPSFSSTVAEALSRLRHEWTAEIEAILAGEYTFWIGSGISRERFPGLEPLLRRLLEEFHARYDPTKPNCPFERALREILLIGGADHVDLSKAVATWPNLDGLLRQLAGRYSDVLNITVREGAGNVEIFWDILELHRLYSDPGVAPDAEHEFMALLALAGCGKSRISEETLP